MREPVSVEDYCQGKNHIDIYDEFFPFKGAFPPISSRLYPITALYQQTLLGVAPLPLRRLFHDNNTLITAQLDGTADPLSGTIEMR
jgi:hypothetical protein